MFKLLSHFGDICYCDTYKYDDVTKILIATDYYDVFKNVEVFKSDVLLLDDSLTRNMVNYYFDKIRDARFLYVKCMENYPNVKKYNYYMTASMELSDDDWNAIDTSTKNEQILKIIVDIKKYDKLKRKFF